MKSITKFLLAAMLLSVTGNSFAKTFRGINSSSTEDRHLSGFRAVNVEGPYDVYITQGNTESVRVEAPADMMSKVLTKVEDGVLKIYNKHETWHWSWWGNHKKITIYVSAKDLGSINLSGSGDVYFKNGLTTKALKLNLVGSGDVTGKVNVKTLECSLSGSGDIRLSGRAENSSVRVVGSGNFSAGSLQTVNTAVHVSGSGDAHINASNKIDASVSGSGDIRYSGTATNVSSSKSGSGDISRM